MRKVGIIGAGLAGLTCGYRLAQKGIRSIIFEQEPIIGGRIPYAAAAATADYQKRTVALIKELDLEDLEIPLKKNEIGMLLDKLVGVEEVPSFAMKYLGAKGVERFMKMSLSVNHFDFGVQNPSPELLKLREISLEDYLKDCPKKVKELFSASAIVLSGEKDLKGMSADYGLSLVRFANELTSGKAVVFEENNLMTITNVLALKLKDEGSEILTSAEVKKIEKQDDKFKIFFEKEGEKIEEVDKVVLSTPLSVTKDIFPGLELETNVKYNPFKIIFVKGKPKCKRKVIIGMPGNPANLCVWLNVLPYEQYIYPIDIEKEVDMKSLYEEYEITGEKKLEVSLPVIPPSPRVPELKTKIEGVYLCGDFYYYPFDTSVVTAEIVAEMIS
jgi:hypothetical protein